ncbi:DUF2795 domain-containing protein [Actinomycetospora endophytica]|uniref:DUF2795 domain-containing protein n=1 Tax=Actinomycetospora endophytica TaxID=2291215 RepID=A0ABS8P8N1_9PSEU|nr:DUF2795 domain-containing protein [Actinomycetospora endophytica]MCD2193865.1 DUF2795 domain-containing protein [Actinomycetospora endophytica]
MSTTPRPVVPAVPGLTLRDTSPAALAERLVPVLSELPFPARRWQVITAGEIYGCDGVTREILARLPEAEYATPQDMVVVLSAALTGRPLPVTSAARGAAPAGRPARPGVPARIPHRALAARRPSMPRPAA